MPTHRLTSEEAADVLGIRVVTLYDWLSQSDRGEFVLRGQPVTIQYYQGGHRGQGRIQVDRKEIERLLSLMRVSPYAHITRKLPTKQTTFQHITTKLGRPED